MTNASTSPEAHAAADRASSAATAHDPYAAMVARCLGKLERVADIGMEMAEELPRKVAGLRPYGAEKYEAEIAAMIGRAYKDVGTTVQRSIAIQMDIIDERRRKRGGHPEAKAEPAAPCPEPPAAEPGAPEPAPAAEDRAYIPRRRDPIADLVNSLLRRVDSRALLEELSQKLIAFDKYPTGVMLAKLAKTLDLELDWRKLITEDWAGPEIQARDPRSPFAFLWAPDRWSGTMPAGDPTDRGGPEPDTPPPD